MFSDRSKFWATGSGHLSEEELLLHLDGELSGRRADGARRHIQACWQCRARAEKVAQTIVRFVECRNALAEEERPPQDWAGFEARLRAARVEKPPAAPMWRRGIPTRRPMRLALATAGVVMALIWIHSGSEQPLSAAEVLRRAQAAEVDAARGKQQPVVYRKIQVKQRSGKKVTDATLESWSDLEQQRQKQTGDQEVWKRLESILRKNHLGDGGILSAADYGAWREGLREKREAVETRRLADGSEVLAINTVTGTDPAPDVILEAALVVRTRDWHAVEQNLRVQGTDEVSEFELSEVGFAVTARNTLPDSIFGGRSKRDAPRPVTPHRAPVTPRLPDPPAPDLDESEILALTALHRSHACLGEPVGIVRENQMLVARGLAETPARKDELAEALRDVPFLRFDVQTVEEVLQASDGVETEPPAGTEARMEQARSKTAPAAGKLKGLKAQEVTALANRVVELSDTVLAHAWALRRLEEAWPAERTSHLSVAARLLLEGLIRDHARDAHDNVSQCRAALEPLSLPAAAEQASDTPESTSWSGEAPALFEQARAAQELTRSLFTGSDLAPDTVEDALTRLAHSLDEVELRSRRLEAGAALISHPSRDAGSLEGKRRP